MKRLHSYVDEHPSQLDTSHPKLNTFHSFEIWALGIVIVVGGDFFSWNAGIVSGFGSFFLATVLVGTAYIILILCTSEMVSAFPFSGGSYGLARCTVGFFAGFLVGCSEALEYIIYVAISASALVSMISSFLGTDKKYQPFFCLIFYSVSNGIHIYGGSVFWKFSNFMGVVSILVVVVYCLGSLFWVDFETNVAGSQVFFLGGIAGFFHILPLPAWFYVGVESLAFSCDMLVQGDPKLIVPRGSIACVMTLFASSMWVLFVCCSLPPGIHHIADEELPLSAGFSLIFKCSNTFATLLSIPATFSTAHGFIFSYGKLLYALANSRLLPAFLKKKSESRGTPFAAIIFGSFVSYIVCLLVFFFPEVRAHLFNICMLCAFVAYCTQCVGYWYMKTKYSGIKRLFKSPFGIAGSSYSFLVFAFGIISVIGFQEDKQIAFISTIVVWGLLSAYYFSYSKHRQTFSTEEQKIFLVVHVINHNVRRGELQRHSHKRRRKMRKGRPSLFSTENARQSSAMGITSQTTEVDIRTRSPVFKCPNILKKKFSAQRISTSSTEIGIRTKRLASFKFPKILQKKSTVRCINVQPTNNINNFF